MSAPPLRLGILGGTFDPVHFGHLAAAEEARVALQLDRVLFVPAAHQPLKARRLTPGEHRLEMLRRAVADHPHFSVSDLELVRGGISYTVDTLRTLRERYPAADLFFILGADALLQLPRWKEASALPDLCRWIVIMRPGYPLDVLPVLRALPGLQGRTTFLPGPKLDISAEELRARIAQGRPIRYQTPEPVVRYIEAWGLYRE